MRVNLKQLFYLKQIIFKIYFGLLFHYNLKWQTLFIDVVKTAFTLNIS